MNEEDKKVYENLSKRVNEGLANLVKSFIKQMDNESRKRLLRDMCDEWL